jgi:hypothetical protein
MNALRVIALALCAGLTLLVGGPGATFENQTGRRAPPSVALQAGATLPGGSAPVYSPPRRGAPSAGSRIGGATRGTGQEAFSLFALAPADHTGLTVREQPSLYWFISSTTASPLEFTISDPKAPRPLLEARLPQPARPGVQRVRLADLGGRLATGVPYEWYVVVVRDPERRSRDILAGGMIERTDLPEALRVKVSAAPPAQVPSLYAEAGLWYDALAAVSDLIESRPHDAGPRRQRAALLEQVGLREAAEHEMKHAQ